MSLFDSLSPSQTDCTDEANAQNAMLDLNRAIDRGGSDELAAWARLYGPSLCQAAIEHRADDDALREAENERDDLSGTISQAIAELDELMGEVEELRSKDTAAEFEAIDRLHFKLEATLNDTPVPQKAAA